MIAVIFFYFFSCPILSQIQSIEPHSLWTKHYLTFSVENYFNNTEEIKSAIKEWDIAPILEFEHVPQSQGDIKYYFVDTLSNNVSGKGFFPEMGNITINRLLYNISEINKTNVYQHEFGHALKMRIIPIIFL